MKISTLTFASLLSIAGVAHAAPVEPTRSVSFCSEKAQLMLIADTAEGAKQLAEQLDKLEQPVCVQRGPHAGAFLIKGTQAAMQVGVIPSGDRSALLVQSPRFLAVPVTALVEATN